MDNAASTIALLVMAGLIFFAMIGIALFVTSDDFDEFMAEEDPEEYEVVDIQLVNDSQNASTSVVGALSWKRSTINKVLNIMGVDTDKKDSVYESRAIMYTTIRGITTFLIVIGALIGIISLVTYLRERKN